MAIKNNNSAKIDTLMSPEELRQELVLIADQITDDEHNTELIHRMGQIYLLQRKPKAAEECLRKILSCDNDSITGAASGLINLFREQGRFSEADIVWDKLNTRNLYAEEEKLLEEGVRYRWLRQWDNSIASLERAISISNTKQNILNQLGLSYHSIRKYQDAEDCYKKAIKIDKSFLDAYFNLVAMFRDMREYAKSSEYLSLIEGFNISSISWKIELERGISFRAESNLEMSEEHILRAISLFPENPEIHYHLGLTFLTKNEYSPAINKFEDVIRMDERFTGAYILSTTILIAQNKLSAAEKNLERVSSLNLPSLNWSIEFQRGLISKSKGELFRSIGYFKIAVSQCEHNPEIYYQLALTYYDIGKFDESKKCLIHSLEKDEYFVESYFSLYIVYARLNKFDQGEKYLSKVKDLIGDELYWKIDFHKGIGSRMKGKYLESEEYLIRALEGNPDDIAILHQLGITCSQRADFESSAVYYKKTIKLDANFIEGYFCLAATFRELGRFQEANEIYDKLQLMNLMAQEWRINFDRGILLKSTGAFDLAKKHFEKAISLLQCDSAQLSQIGCNLELLDEKMLALKCYNLALVADHSITFL